jgi:hypothetical protein
MRKHSVCLLLLLLVTLTLANAQAPSAKPSSEPALPYSPSLDVSSMDKSIDPCVDLYHYSCGGWQQKNPIPPDQTSWSVYAKMYQDNLMFLRGMLEQAAQPDKERNAVTQKIGDFYAACMDEAAVEKRGLAPLQPQLDAIAQIKSAKDLTPVVAHLQFTFFRYSYTSSMLFNAGSRLLPQRRRQVERNPRALPAACAASVRVDRRQPGRGEAKRRNGHEARNGHGQGFALPRRAPRPAQTGS